MKLIHVVAGGFSCAAVGGHSPPDLILDHQHPDLLHLLAQFPDVIADETVFDIHVRSVIEEIEGSFHIDLQCRRHMLCFLLLLEKQLMIQILKDRHVFRSGVIEIALIDAVYAAVNDGFLYRKEAFLSSDDQLTERKD